MPPPPSKKKKIPWGNPSLNLTLGILVGELNLSTHTHTHTHRVPQPGELQADVALRRRPLSVVDLGVVVAGGGVARQT